MNDKKDEVGNLLSDEKRLTKLEFSFETSLDEIPQLINMK
jgi:sugar transferase EpsL